MSADKDQPRDYQISSFIDNRLKFCAKSSGIKEKEGPTGLQTSWKFFSNTKLDQNLA